MQLFDAGRADRPGIRGVQCHGCRSLLLDVPIPLARQDSGFTSAAKRQATRSMTSGTSGGGLADTRGITPPQLVRRLAAPHRFTRRAVQDPARARLDRVLLAGPAGAEPPGGD